MTGPTGRAAHGLVDEFGPPPDHPEVPPERRMAWSDFVQGREIIANYDQARYDQADAALRRAISQDPTFVDARAELVRLMLQRAWYGAGSDSLDDAEAEVRKALDIEPNNPRALQVLGRLLPLFPALVSLPLLSNFAR